MTQNEAGQLWFHSCMKEFGVDENGCESLEPTVLGGAALGRSIPINYATTVINKSKVAAFLREWADAIEGVNKNA